MQEGTIRINIPPMALELNPSSAPGKFHFILGMMFSAFFLLFLGSLFAVYDIEFMMTKVAK
jgi:hypothetical protein